MRTNNCIYTLKVNVCIWIGIHRVIPWSFDFQDFEDFDLANEDDVLEEFLGIPRKNPKAEPVATDAVPEEAAKLEVGKLPADSPEITAPENTNGTSEEVPMETDKLA